MLKFGDEGPCEDTALSHRTRTLIVVMLAIYEGEDR